MLPVLLVELSSLVGRDALTEFPRLFGATAESSLSMLGTIAGSIITVAGVTFSVMVVAVSQASGQYSPRILRNFLRDRGSQMALGVLAGTFVYCLVVIRTVRTEEDDFIPEFAVLGSLVLALLAIGFLMYFIHHIASTLEPGRILAQVYDDTIAAIDKLFPDPLGTEHPKEDAALERSALSVQDWRILPAQCTGYIQYVDIEGMIDLSTKCNAVIRMERRIGEFVVMDMPLVSISAYEADERLIASVNDLFTVGNHRSVYQDASFGIRQIVDMGNKALSPSVNDVTTAVTCIDYLRAVLVRMAGRRIPSPYRAVDGELRIVAHGSDFREAVDIAVTEIRRAASGNVRVLLALIDTLEAAGTATGCRQRKQLLLDHVQLIRRTADQGVSLPFDLAVLTAACDRAQAALHTGSSSNARA